MTGYSGTPLAKKLGIVAGTTLVLADAPENYRDLFDSWPEDVVMLPRVAAKADVIHLFVTSRAALASHLKKCLARMRDDATIWVSWPKKSSKVATDLTEDAIREIALPMHFVDIKSVSATNAGSFEPRDPDFRARVAASFARQNAMATLGIALVRVEPGEVEVAFAHHDDLTQQHGFIHAGILATALDTACGYAAFSLMASDAAVLSIEFKINLLAPARGDRFRFVGRVVKPGRTITVCEAQAISCSGDESKLVATMTATMMAVFDREGVAQ
jgi:uncharacterized protein (TIGR00369 family)